MSKMERVTLNVFMSFPPPQSHAPVDLYLMTKNPQDAPSTPDVLEIEFKNGAVMKPYLSPALQNLLIAGIQFL